MAVSYTLAFFEHLESHTSEAGLIIFLPLMYCTPPPTLVDTNTLKRMIGGNSLPPNLQQYGEFCNRLASDIIHDGRNQQ